MAKYTFKDHHGLTANHGNKVRDIAHNLVQQAATRVSWNDLGAAPGGFTPTQVNNQVLPIHTRTNIQFKAGFRMREKQGNQKWEGQATVEAYRLDLQSINNGWANWAIQTNGQNSVTVATCLMKVDQDFSQNQLAHGLIQSAI